MYIIIPIKVQDGISKNLNYGLKMKTAEIDTRSPIPLYYQVKDIIKNQILSGEVQPEAPLVSENMLMKKYNISRNTARQALTYLVNEGLAYRIQGKGTYAAIPDKKVPENRKGVIGYILFGRRFDNPFYAETLSGVDMAAKKFKKHLLFTEIETQTSRDELPLMVRENTVDGIIITGVVSRKVLNMMDNANMPYVLIGVIEPDDKHYVVKTDAEKGTIMIMDYLARKGHKKIAFLNGNNSYVEYHQIGQTFKNIMKKNGYSVSPEMSVCCNQFNVEQAYEATLGILAACKSEYPTAIFAANYMMAFGAMKALLKNNLRVPHDISIIACGNYGKNEALNYYSEISITSVEYDIRNVGRNAAEILIDIIDGKPDVRKTVLLPPVLKEGNSVKDIK